ncbi:N-acetylglucosamine-6-phosphate deacetylase [Nitratireductor alexandrii]|uniref:N-acetylglucosamine-6-phosphate deacetylase n=1 Tax=Nitratireductor alexandrii TaxID=2448161 RepID=UPI000FD9D3AA|nr:N-acetylglucosamine-6-phosphate deacetylase [Nitratireductor alexandrii]
MMTTTAFVGADIFDGARRRQGMALIVRDGTVADIVADGELPAEAETVRLDGGLLAPGFVDLQVNGGGGVMLNDRQDVATIRTICAAHAGFGTTALLPTLITDRPAVSRAAIEAAAEAAADGVAGLIGLHLEGPYLSPARKGAHDPALIRPMDDDDEAFLLAARKTLPALLVTLAPEAVAPERIARLTTAGIVVSLGHSNASYAAAAEAAEAGASMVTHLFNAMSQIANREPGLVGAAIDLGALSAGLIADGIHVDAANIRTALKAKSRPGRIFLVTDAMATIGTTMESFTLNGRTIRRREGRLTLEDGTLAGADLDMISAVRFMHRRIGVPLEEALRMASLYPAQAMGIDARHGRLAPGTRADMVHLSDALEIAGVWIGGRAAAR